jgi:hypothetical protein
MKEIEVIKQQSMEGHLELGKFKGEIAMLKEAKEDLITDLDIARRKNKVILSVSNVDLGS